MFNILAWLAELLQSHTHDGTETSQITHTALGSGSYGTPVATGVALSAGTTTAGTQVSAFDHVHTVNVPRARAYHNTTQSLTNGTLTAVALNSERYDTNAFHDTATNNSRMTIPAGYGGLYLMIGCVEFASNGLGDRRLHIRVNGSTYIAVQTIIANSTDRTSIQVATEYELAAGDYVELIAYQSSGGSLNLESNANRSPEFTISLRGS